ncbi:5'-deoxynucleotidase [Ruminococcus sp. Marseille-P6503]|uniref:5'-deoxynucleotidase n=1 Tax=Ruminococcus sp. Marseille-P6503 TaxID=2364796 RepID=UPI000F54B5C2|nr:5'-deoxynucleotidase [Ruminococcus sp. Marseille-P6503]
MESKFFAVISRMKYINRWSLMRNTIPENISEHSIETAFIAHALALLRNKRFGGNVNAERCALIALYHDVSEIITGDLPTPVKYYNKDIKSAYGEIENKALCQLLSYLPDDLKEEYSEVFFAGKEDRELWTLVKAADKISALIKCVEERRMGNSDFASAEKSTLEAVHRLNVPEAEVFLEEFMPSYNLTLDEQC